MGYACRALLSAHTHTHCMHSISAHYLEVQHCSLTVSLRWPPLMVVNTRPMRLLTCTATSSPTAKWNGQGATGRELSYLPDGAGGGQKAESTQRLQHRYCLFLKHSLRSAKGCMGRHTNMFVINGNEEWKVNQSQGVYFLVLLKIVITKTFSDIHRV